MELNVGLGAGLMFGLNKITTNIDVKSASDKLIEKKEDGLYVPSLVGKDGGPGGSSPDNWTVIEKPAGSGKIQTNRDVVQMIFTMCLWKTGSRSASRINLVNPLTRKTKADIISEINWRKNQNENLSAYDIIAGDLFQLKQYVTCPTVSWGTTYEDGNRYAGDFIHALFVVESITRDGSLLNKVTDIKMRCLYSDNTAGYTVGAILA